MNLPDEKRVLVTAIARRLRDMPRHRAALEVAMARFEPNFDLTAFVRAAESFDPDQLLRAYPIQSGFENIQNHITGLTRDALELVGGLAPSERPNAARDLRRLQRLGALSAERCEILIRVQELRSSLQHRYAETGPADLHAAVIDLLGEIDGFLIDFARWIKTAISASAAYPSSS